MASFLHHARFAFLAAFQLLTAASLLVGGYALWLAPALITMFLLFDEVFVDRSAPDYRHTGLLNALLYVNLPCLAVLSACYAYYLGDADPLHLEAVADAAFGSDLAMSRAAAHWAELVVVGMAVALFYGAAGINVAHELIHRLDRPIDRTIGRWLLAFCLDTTFSIEHVWGHHRHVATWRDPASARRGEYVLAFVVRSTVGCFLNAFRIERDRLARQGRSAWSWRNRALRGQAMSLTIAVAFYWLAGWTGVVVFVLLALHGKAYLEGGNYIEHYGLVRIAGAPVEARHSWDCDRAISTVFLCNLTRHADHHMAARKPFWTQEICDRSPKMPHGYAMMILISLVAPLWRRTTDPILADWDRHLASEAERDALGKLGWSIADHARDTRSVPRQPAG